MPRLPISPRVSRAAAAILAASGMLAGVAQSATASTLLTAAPRASAAPAASSVSSKPLLSATIPAASPLSTTSPVAPLSSSTSTGTTTTSLLWNGDLSTASFSQYAWLWACPGGVTLNNAATYMGKPTATFTVTDTSTKTYCPGEVFTSSPTASLLSPPLFGNNADTYVGFGTKFPVGFPLITNWFQFSEIFGPPYGGSPTIGFDVKGSRLGLWRDGTHHYDNPWSAPISYGNWEYIQAHIKFSTNPSIGFIEIWLNGVKQHFTNGSTRLYYDTLLPGDNWNGYTKNTLYLDQYRQISPLLGTQNIYHADAKVGTTLASVAP